LDASAVLGAVPVQPGIGCAAVAPLPSSAECTRLAEVDVTVTPPGNPSWSSREYKTWVAVPLAAVTSYVTIHWPGAAPATTDTTVFETVGELGSAQAEADVPAAARTVAGFEAA
jgi:hypothetical protein